MRTYKERTQRILDKAKVKQVRRKQTITLASILGSIVALIIALNLVLFVPYTVGKYDIAKYKGSEYYELMDTIGQLTYRQYKTNNFERWGLDNLFGGHKGMDMEPGMESSGSQFAQGTIGSTSSNNGSSHYEEVTNNQVAGVTEGDLFKRSSEYIYYIQLRSGYNDIVYDKNGNEIKEYVTPHIILRTYSFEKENLELISEFRIFPSGNMWFENSNGMEMYLSPDCNTVTIIVEEIGAYKSSRIFSYTTVINIDVSDPSTPKEISRKSVSGSLVSSRIVDDTLLLVTNFTLFRNTDFSTPSAYLPQIGEAENMESLPMDDILVPDNATDARYSIISSFDSATLEINDSVALFSYTSTIYVSENHLFVARDIMQTYHDEIPGVSYNYSMESTEIACIAYDDKELNFRETIVVDGTIVNQYSLDEYENVLRVFTTTNKRLSSWSVSDYTAADSLKFGIDMCNLYCYDLDSFELIASVEDFSDPDESVKSVRFDGNKAYVCTASIDYSWVDIFIACDPVFEFDLSDYNNITSTDTGTIPGYSLSLIRFMDGLLGIGYGDDSRVLKIEFYQADGEMVNCVAKYELKNCEFSDEFKAYFIDSNRGIIGLGVSYEDWLAGRWAWNQYLLLRFDGEMFIELGFYDFELTGGTDFFTGNLDSMRACYVDGYIYIFCDSRANVVNFDELISNTTQEPENEDTEVEESETDEVIEFPNVDYGEENIE
ncbi:MAG: beta-propeller domain-containing protein [Clostridiales bacterium]|nr:beta-propeller domain-containing protein [Clostridiales bacterium]